MGPSVNIPELKWWVLLVLPATIPRGPDVDVFDIRGVFSRIYAIDFHEALDQLK
jgi:hypothetical protein